MLNQLHKDMKDYVTASGTFSDKISVENGVKQGNILTLTLFSIYFAVLLMFAFNDCDTDIYLRFRTSLKVFILRRFDAKTKTFEMLIHELLYADDAPFIAHSVEDMQLIMDRFSFACTAFGLTISLKKTKAMFTPAQGEPYNEPNIVVNDTRWIKLTLLYILGALCLQTDLCMLKYTCVFKNLLFRL